MSAFELKTRLGCGIDTGKVGGGRRPGGKLCLRPRYCGVQEQLGTVVAKLERGKL
jgi:hypothetical protein